MKDIYNKRMKKWYDLNKLLGLVKTQQELATHLVSTTGSNYSQAFVSRMMQSAPIPKHIFEQLAANYPYTSEDYFITGNSAIIDKYKLLRYLNKKHDITFDYLADKIDGLKRSYISKMADHTDDEDWQRVFEFYNDNYGYNLHASAIELEGAPLNPDEQTSEHVGRLIKVVEALINAGAIINAREFCDACGINKNVYYNMKSANTKQDVTKDMLYRIGVAFPKVSIDYILFGTGSIFRSADSDLTSVHMLYSMIKSIESAVSKIQYDLSILSRVSLPNGV